MRNIRFLLQFASVRYSTVHTRCPKYLPGSYNTLISISSLNVSGISSSLRSTIRKFTMSASSKPGLLLIGILQHAQQESERLRTKYDVLQFTGNRNEFFQHCKQGNFNHVVGLYCTNSTKKTGPFDKELVLLLPDSLKYIGLNGAGYDGMDIATCTERNIRISNTPNIVANATADVAMFLLLGAIRHAMIPLQTLRDGRWKEGAPLGHDPYGKTLGILGMGAIGQALAHRARAFRLRIIYHNRTRLPKDKEGSATYVTFDELLRSSDILSLNLPATPDTRHTISQPQFDVMKDGVVVINTARGSLINEAALVDALNSGRVLSAGLDVYEDEPKVHPGLISNDRVMLLPHIGTATVETKREMELLALRNLEHALDHGDLLTPIREQS